ncbi:MAG: response regulator [Melioribacteraceae bacterium]|nr:response regulator [Melioribacteraceae bacterium]
MEKIKIVYAEDSKYISNVVVRNLEHEGYLVYHFNDGLNVFQKVKELKPDLILLDNLMPNKDGFTVLKELKSNDETKNIPVIFFTSEADKNKIIQGIGAGLVDYIVKEPGTIGELIPRIKNIIEKLKINK